MSKFIRLTGNQFEVESKEKALMPEIGKNYIFNKRLVTSEVTLIESSSNKEVVFNTRNDKYKVEF